MENKTHNVPVYRCAICDTAYKSIADRVKCEQACLKKQEEEAKKIAEEKKKAEQEASTTEVTQAIEHAQELLNKHLENYGTYHYNGKISNVKNMDYFPIKLWHNFW